MSPDDEDLLHDLLDRWEEAQDRGMAIPAAELCGDRSDLHDELARRIASLAKMRQFEAAVAAEPQQDDLPPQIDGTPGLLNGRYRLERKLGEGTEGQVWLAHDTLLKRDAAVKLPWTSSNDLLDEARLIASLQHPNILKVLDVGHYGEGRVFVVTELMTGRTLADRIGPQGGGRISVSRAINWAGQIASALHAVHLAGRAHRDVKPVNILLDEYDNAVLADFGIAIDVTAEDSRGSTGTPAYKSPEQLAGQRLDARSDVYSLGLVVHELLAGCLPFTKLDAETIDSEIRSGVDMRVSRRVPARLRPVVTRALSLHPHNRYESAPQFARELEQAWRRSTLGRWVAALTLAVLAGLVAWGWRVRQDHRRMVEAGDRQIKDVMKHVHEGMRLEDEALRKVQEVQSLGQRIVEETMNDPFHRARKAENEARRRAGREGEPTRGEAAPAGTAP